MQGFVDLFETTFETFTGFQVFGITFFGLVLLVFALGLFFSFWRKR